VERTHTQCGTGIPEREHKKEVRIYLLMQYKRQLLQFTLQLNMQLHCLERSHDRRIRSRVQGWRSMKLCPTSGSCCCRQVLCLCMLLKVLQRCNAATVQGVTEQCFRARESRHPCFRHGIVFIQCCCQCLCDVSVCWSVAQPRMQLITTTPN
jgi:hypothetical protein